MKALDDYLPGSIKGKTILITGERPELAGQQLYCFQNWERIL